MRAQYLVRFDDVCPTMNWSIWGRIESILIKHNVKPILAVVPDNRDPMLMVDPACENFWERVRAWQAAGWTIALHGYQHRYETRHSGLLGVNGFSEFAGLSYAEQRAKLVQAVAVFTTQGVRVDGWVAPAHAFDATTVKVMLELGIHVISDGFYSRPIKRLGALWIPQQMWRFRDMPFGVWTVCYHHNHLSESAIGQFEVDVARFAPAITSVDEVVRSYPIKKLGFLDAALALAWLTALRFKRRMESL